LGDSQSIGNFLKASSHKTGNDKIPGTTYGKGFHVFLEMLKKFWHAGWLYTCTKQKA